MSEATPPLDDPEVLNNGTPAGLFLFLTPAAQRGDLPKAQTDNLRVGVRKVLDVVSPRTSTCAPPTWTTSSAGSTR